jgi:cytochrome c2
MLAGLVAFPVITAHGGGWATITVESLPDYIVAQRPVDLTFTVRQHGNSPLDDLTPAVRARAGQLVAKAAVLTGKKPGQYTATLTVPQPGAWTITIESGFGNSRVTLLPLRAIDSGAPAPQPLPEAERGRRLFVAKGCLTCHVHGEITGSGEVAVGPPLTGRRWPADYLRQFIADPPATSSSNGGSLRMPDLDLGPQEVAALIAFLNTESKPQR